MSDKTNIFHYNFMLIIAMSQKIAKNKEENALLFSDGDPDFVTYISSTNNKFNSKKVSVGKV